jgi:hypothetical protein
MDQDDHAEPVQVFIRICPEINEHGKVAADESNKSSRCVIQMDDKTIKIVPPDNTQSRKTVSAVDDRVFKFDQIFPSDSSQEGSSAISILGPCYSSTLRFLRAQGTRCLYTLP